MKLTRRADSGILRTYLGSYGETVFDTSNSTLVFFTGDTPGGHQLASESSLNIFRRAQVVTPVDFWADQPLNNIYLDGSASNNFRIFVYGDLNVFLPDGLNDGQIVNIIFNSQHDGMSTPFNVWFDMAYDFGAAGAPQQLPSGQSKSLLSGIWDQVTGTLLCSWRPGAAFVPVAT